MIAPERGAACPACGKGRLHQVEAFREVFFRGKRRKVYGLLAEECDRCGELAWSDAELLRFESLIKLRRDKRMAKHERRWKLVNPPRSEWPCPSCGELLERVVVSETRRYPEGPMFVEGLMPYECTACRERVWPDRERRRGREQVDVKLGIQRYTPGTRD